MYKFIRKVNHKLDLNSGEFIHIGLEKKEDVTIKIIDYDSEDIHEKEIKSMEEYIQYETKPTVTWVNVDGLEPEVIEKIGRHFNLHDLIIEDILNTGQHPMMEDFGDYFFIVLKMIYCGKKEDNIIVEHLSLLLGKNFVITFQECSEGDVFDPIRKKLRQGKGRIRKMGSGYLAYALIDAIVDNYFAALNKISEEVEYIESELANNPPLEIINNIYDLKKELIFLHKAVWPLREVISRLQREDTDLSKEMKGIYIRDLYDNVVQVIDAVQTFRDMLSGMLDVYMSCNANKMNQIMKILTIISTIFIPLSFITSIYGMNIVMPEKDCPWTYPIVIGIMFFISTFMILFFRKKRWI